MYNVCIMCVCIYIYLHTYITLHYITLHYVTLHYIRLHYITLHYITYIHTYITYTYIYSWSTTQQHGKCHFYSFLSNTVDLSYLCNLQTWTNDPDPNRVATPWPHQWLRWVDEQSCAKPYHGSWTSAVDTDWDLGTQTWLGKSMEIHYKWRF